MEAADLLDVIYTAGVVFDGLSTSRPATDRYLRLGDTDGVRCRGDLALLQDLEAAARFIIDHAEHPFNAEYLCQINAQLTRSAALNPGALRRAEQGIGVRTALGRHERPALTMGELAVIVDKHWASPDALNAAATLFVEVARAQPFEDGNKRTAIFAANGLLLRRAPGVALAVPHDDDDPQLSVAFNDLLARAYILGEVAPAVRMLLDYGARPLGGER